MSEKSVRAAGKLLKENEHLMEHNDELVSLLQTLADSLQYERGYEKEVLSIKEALKKSEVLMSKTTGKRIMSGKKYIINSDGSVVFDGCILNSQTVEKLVDAIIAIPQNYGCPPHIEIKYGFHVLDNCSLNDLCKEYVEGCWREPTYSAGDRFYHTPSGKEYLLTVFPNKHAMLVNVSTSKVTSMPKPVKNTNKIRLIEVTSNPDDYIVTAT